MTDPADRRSFLSFAGLGAGALALIGCRAGTAQAAERFPVTKPDAEWRRQLGTAAYDVLRHEGTERPGSSPLNDEHRAGTFACKGCAQPLFSSRTKFDSGTGWPSFYAPLANAVGTRTDRSMFMARTEVHCDRCGGHLGHVFDDGPRPTGKRYCMNGVAMTFRKA
ncbi:peptide-methionine (R)-S-oxide reductase MsrB [Sphingomonas rubra]|uniref:peptide-methionine (R)-S-oxide reductase n=1 Tax=Sphingomonas rubra TaxID=634430 RepID=A0A1I5U2Z7_9SPHN|nr:peptide-methionine (R)-S-oxide reductase MsrB [Sphingomonas rubra]SFP89639.1 peptide-methionine (R)-S-oxide reductase [Sphingomonas rubra]